MPVSASFVIWRVALPALALVAAIGTATPSHSRANYYTFRKANTQSMVPQVVATPADRDRRLREKGMQFGSPMLIRIFKAESELEVWMLKDGQYERFQTYPICRFSGKLGPKQREGDKQAPEGFYSVSTPHLHRHGRWKRALDVGYPNALDRANGRSGSAILVHGGCSSIGCFAMTNPVMEEIFTLSEAALASGQDTLPIHIFPFRMTEEKLAAQNTNQWSEFWRNLKQAYDSFERTRQPPHVSVCGRRYMVRDGSQDSAAPSSPRRMIKLARMMRGERPVLPGECPQESTPTPEAIAAASRIAHTALGTAVPSTPEASMPVPAVPVPVLASRPARQSTPISVPAPEAEVDMPIPPVPVPAIRNARAN